MARACRDCGRIFPNRVALEAHVERTHGRPPKNTSRNLYVAVGIMVMVAVLGVVYLATQVEDPSSRPPAERFNVDRSPRTGSETAPVLFVAFESPDCPSCRIFHVGTGSGPSPHQVVMDDYVATGLVQYVEKTAFIGEPWEREGAALQKCVWHMDEALFFDITAMFYEKQFEIGRDNVHAVAKAWAQDKPIDGDALVACAQANEHDADIEMDLRDGALAGVRGTPTFIVITRDGGHAQTIIGPQPVNTFRGAIDRALRKAAEDVPA